MKQKSWISIVFSFASQCRGKIALSVLCAIISVVAGLIPYWSVYQIITLFIGGSPVMAEVWKWCWIGLGAYAIRFLLYGISTSLSHISAYTILENIRLTLAQRLMKAPLGTVIGESVGKLKSVLVDRVETIELPLAHMIPECISNLLLPVAVFVYLVCIDWRMALAMLVTVPLAFIAFAMMMKNFNKLYADYMESNNYVNGVIVLSALLHRITFCSTAPSRKIFGWETLMLRTKKYMRQQKPPAVMNLYRNWTMAMTRWPGMQGTGFQAVKNSAFLLPA